MCVQAWVILRMGNGQADDGAPDKLAMKVLLINHIEQAPRGGGSDNFLETGIGLFRCPLRIRPGCEEVGVERTWAK